MMSKDLKIVIFDMDGVVLDSEPLHENARQIMFKELGIVPDETFPDFMIRLGWIKKSDNWKYEIV